MIYDILESRVIFKNNKLDKIFVLIDCTSLNCEPYSDVRAVFATTDTRAGYMSISPNTNLDFELLQKIAASGSESYDRDKIFTNWKEKLEEKLKNLKP